MSTAKNILLDTKKTQRDRAAALNGLAIKIGAENLATFTPRDIKDWQTNSTPELRDRIQRLEQVEKEYDRQRAIDHLCNNMPLETLDKEIASKQADLKEWAGEFVKNPTYKLEWANGIFQVAAEQKVLQTIRGWLSKVEYYDEPGYWEKIEEYILKQVLNRKMNEYQIFKSGPRKGQPKTLTDRVVRFLVEGLKYREVSSRSKYRQFAKFDPETNSARNYFVGKAGAVRSGKSASDSISITDRVHANMKLWETKLQKLVDDINDKLAAGEGAR